ncbi:LUD domain-containing protein [Yinghuangia sp. ASG 101]|uniref:LutC/YkgG family protein n=1 Tax=Yinghuangia sp. ASG 101 TaxID=2896848 RepID=UPI001E48F077|nr:LUD domain-containing protein [Yinghuangia sp. ASG 101]UGQ09395.1 LUD domain-containing protein [Yinghuangia sp. ASG 101]
MTTSGAPHDLPDTHASHTALEHIDLTGPGPHTATPGRAELPHRPPGLPTDAKAAIMDRLRDALADGGPPEPVAVDRGYRRLHGQGTDLIAMFAERVTDFRTLVARADAFTMVRTTAALLRRAGVRRLAAPPDHRLTWLTAAGAELVGEERQLTDRPRDRADGAVTGCALAIAETGTIVLDGGRYQGRRMLSLLPGYHLCVVRAEQIVGTVPEAVARLDPRRPQTWISGRPTAPAPTEESAPGPRTLHVLLLG